MKDEIVAQKNHVKNTHAAVIEAQGKWRDAHEVLLARQREFNDAVEYLAKLASPSEGDE